jgi:lipopolysaccharide transport system permease protein
MNVPARLPGAARDLHVPQRIVIEPASAWKWVDLNELIAHRDLFRFLVWRQIRVRYAQSFVGIGWALIQPLLSMLVLTVIFGYFMQIQNESAPYALLSLSALVPWFFFSNSVTDAVASLVNEANLLSKVYFPRLLLPLAAICSKGVDFAIGMLVLLSCLLMTGHTPSLRIALLPLFILLLLLVTIGWSVLLASLAVQYRDVKHALGFCLQLAMYATPIVYPLAIIPESYQCLYAINPLVAIVEGFRYCLLDDYGLPWPIVGIGAISTLLTLTVGLYSFWLREQSFADVV